MPHEIEHYVGRMNERGIKPEMAAGHSLGEFTAFTAAGALSFVEGLRLVARRAEAMAAAAQVRPGAMAAIIGLDQAALEEICAALSPRESAVIANINSDPATGLPWITAIPERACIGGIPNSRPLRIIAAAAAGYCPAGWGSGGSS